MDRRDPICGMQGTIERYGRWFCSDGCAAESAARIARGDGAGASMGPRWTDPWIWVPASGALLLVAGQASPAVRAVGDRYLDYVLRTGVPFLAGLGIGGLVDRFIPRAYIIKLLSGSRKRVVVRATFLGLLASTCSHGCLALSMELYRKGASTPAVISFLLASPWASMALTLLLLSLFGARGLLFILGALGIACATGLLMQRLERRRLIDVNPRTLPMTQGFSIRRDLRARWRRYPWTAARLADDARGVVSGAVSLGRMVLGWFQLGLLLSALLGTWLPHHLFEQWMGPTPLGLLLTLMAASVIEVCSEGSAPLAFELYRHTGALGNAFVFLMAGVVTDVTELGAVWSTIGRRTVIWLLVVALPMVVALGLMLNLWLS